MNEVTQILAAIEQGDPHAAEQLLPLVYEELRKLATQRLAQEKPGQTLQATALVHEAYIRLVAGGDGSAPREQHWNSRGHFFAAVAEAMRRILVESARKKRRGKRGGGQRRRRFCRTRAAFGHLRGRGRVPHRRKPSARPLHTHPASRRIASLEDYRVDGCRLRARRRVDRGTGPALTAHAPTETDERDG
jgi:hypothetical protein